VVLKVTFFFKVVVGHYRNSGSFFKLIHGADNFFFICAQQEGRSALNFVHLFSRYRSK
jgi:hypothetical protein